MAEEKSKSKKSEIKSTASEWANKSIRELKSEYQKLYLNVKTGIEKNSSLLKKLRKVIARKLTSK